MKKLSFLLTVLCMLCASSINAETRSGTHIPNLTWTLDTETGVLTISGSGRMSYNYYGNYPWNDYKTLIKELIINEGITNITDNAFMDCNNIKTISLPNSFIDLPDYSLLLLIALRL